MNEHTQLKADQDAYCSLCGSPGRVIASGHPGYRDGNEYSILECEYCDLQFSNPKAVPNGLYEEIYRNSNILPGYTRYASYQKAVASEPKPLDWLAEKEAAYWFVRSELRGMPSTLRILEVGSGLGYLTYGLRTAGYNATGVDLSAEAVEQANQRFGDYFICADINVLTQEKPGSFDVVILTEVIEHVSDPVGFIKSVRGLLADGGVALVSTPNKSIARMNAVWDTESPPVHLSWFSETAIRRLAERAGFGIRFFDFTEMNRRGTLAIKTPSSARPYPPFLTEDGEVSAYALSQTRRSARPQQSGVKRLLHKAIAARDTYRFVNRAYSQILQRSPQIGAILTKRD